MNQCEQYLTSTYSDEATKFLRDASRKLGRDVVAWVPFSDYDLWKTTDPRDYEEREPQDICCWPGCRELADYQGYCEPHFEEARWQAACDEMPENEWGMMDL
jgi:hypothetical protein